MNTVLWVLGGLTAWSVVSVPLALVVGRALGRSDSGSPPTASGPTAPVLVA